MPSRDRAAYMVDYRKRRKVDPPPVSIHAACDLRIAALQREVATLRDRLALRELFD